MCLKVSVFAVKDSPTGWSTQTSNSGNLKARISTVIEAKVFLVVTETRGFIFVSGRAGSLLRHRGNKYREIVIYKSSKIVCDQFV